MSARESAHERERPGGSDPYDRLDDEPPDPDKVRAFIAHARAELEHARMLDTEEAPDRHRNYKPAPVRIVRDDQT
jgi:hypothetical protein